MSSSTPSLPPGLRRCCGVALAVVALTVAGCSNDPADEGAETTQAAGDTSETTAVAAGTEEVVEPVEQSVESFCSTLTEIVGQEAGEQQYEPLQASAPDEIAGVVDDLAEAAEEARTTEEPGADLQERGVRSVVGVTVYAIDECDDTAGLAEAIGIDEAGIELLSKYTLEDVQDDDTWAEISAALRSG
ncbi:MAG: hypothetical protein KDB24_01125 [Microthrixaceae bacterium]|nr:hypothetical protein [Microthrixaceae bacterium]